MRYTLFFLIILSFKIIQSKAQANNETVEVRLELLQQSVDSKDPNLSLGVSIINHYNRDIFILNFLSYKINYYKKTDSTEWREIDYDTHDFYKELPPRSDTMKRREAIQKNINANTDNFFKRNSLSRFYEKTASMNFFESKKIMWAYCDETKQKIENWMLLAGYPLFIKAGQEIRIYHIYSLDFVLQDHAQYRIEFNAENRGADRRTKEWANQYVSVPDSIFSYHLFMPKEFTTNPIYFTSLPSELKQRF